MCVYRKEEIYIERINIEEICQDSFKEKSGIYYFKCTKNNKGYVGQSVHLKKRVTSHINQLNNNTHKNVYWQRCWNKYGLESFELFILEYCESDLLNEKEINWIHELKTTYPDGFNMTTGGDGSYIISDDSRKRMSEVWTQERKDELGKRTKTWWDSLSQEEYSEWCKKLKNHWTDERRNLISFITKNRWNSMSEEERADYIKNIKENHADCSGDKNSRARSVKCIETNEIFTTIKEAAKVFEINYSTLKGHLQGRSKSVKGYHFEYIT